MQKIIIKIIRSILIKYQKSLDKEKLDFKDYMDQTLYFELGFIIRLLGEKLKSLDRTNI